MVAVLVELLGAHLCLLGWGVEVVEGGEGLAHVLHNLRRVLQPFPTREDQQRGAGLPLVLMSLIRGAKGQGEVELARPGDVNGLRKRDGRTLVTRTTGWKWRTGGWGSSR